MSSQVERYSKQVKAETVANVSNASQTKVTQRVTALDELYEDPNQLQVWASRVKGFVLDNLGELLVQFEQNCIANGIQIHWAEDAAEANAIILELCRQGVGTTIVKAKSMATE